ncbi:hypothetical protein [Sagittula stellata]|uniref:Bacteriophage tail tape measure C-terminal domain-containing protein n=1 Tax=Sagittula stellata (strain ATCC 700073 / DSM 11524 / E-37) TaxID=388399 RepID=A3KA63_SAGS3|nr:hypothetical protein [Sagittula stellata]EBA06006.1 hypothetical protein SSE37_25398 [Sagittula stellata E-37]
MAEADDLLVSIGLTEKKYLATIARLEAQTQKAAKGMERSFERSNRSFVRGSQRANASADAFANGGLRQIGMQLSQVAQQGAVTGDYFRALSVQAADIGLTFGTAGIAVGALISVLGPMALELVGASDDADAAEDSLKRFTAAASQAKDMAGIAKTPIGELREEFGEFADEVQRAAQIAAQAALSIALREMGAISEGLRSGLQGVVSDLQAVQRASDALDSVLSAERQGLAGPEQVMNARDALAVLRDEANEAAAELGLTVLQVAELEGALRDLDKAQGMRDVANAAADAIELIDGMFDSTENIPPEVALIVQHLKDVLTSAASGALAFDDVADAASGAADEAERLARALFLSQRIGLNADLADEDAVMSQNVIPDAGDRAGQREALENFHNILERASRKKRRGGGRKSRGLSEVEKEEAKALREVERYVDKTRTAVEEYHAELEELAALKPFFEQTVQAEAYARAVAMVNEEFKRSQNETFIRAIEDVSDAMAQTIVDGEDMGAALRNVFRQIARDLIASGIRELLMSTFGFGSKRSGGFLGNVFGGLLSFDGGGFTGVGARSGGVDGKGGFPAILHPNETVLDHTKGQSSGGSVGITVGVDGQGNIVPLIRRVSGQVSVQVTGSAMQAQRQSFAGQIQATEARGTSK